MTREEQIKVKVTKMIEPWLKSSGLLQEGEVIEVSVSITRSPPLKVGVSAVKPTGLAKDPQNQTINDEDWVAILAVDFGETEYRTTLEQLRNNGNEPVSGKALPTGIQKNINPVLKQNGLPFAIRRVPPHRDYKFKLFRLHK